MSSLEILFFCNVKHKSKSCKSQAATKSVQPIVAKITKILVLRNKAKQLVQMKFLRDMPKLLVDISCYKIDCVSELKNNFIHFLSKGDFVDLLVAF